MILDSFTPASTAMATVAASEPAGGAEMGQVVIATAGATVVTLVLLWLIRGHRAGRVSLLTDLAAFASRISGLPGWAALPSGIGGGALMIALLGMYWDISLHIDQGRDAGPLANPAHYLILVGLYGVFAAGVLAMALPKDGEKPGPGALRITESWHVPVGGVLMAACGAFALIGFPLDDVWHRLFGQDVTLWGPTHLMLIGGAGMTLVGQAVLLAEGMHHQRAKRAASDDAPEHRGTSSAVTYLRRASLMGGFLIGLSTFQAEFDFGVPQYRAVMQPLLIALAASIALVGARVWIGRGGALAAVAFYFVVRGGVSLLTGPVFGQTTPSVPLYMGEALLVELVAISLIRRPLALGAVSGALIGTVGFAIEYAWSHLAMPLPWRDDIVVEGLVLATAVGVVGGMTGALLALGLRAELPRPRVTRSVMAATLVVVSACVVDGLITSSPENASVTVGLTDARAPGTGSGGKEAAAGRNVDAIVRVTPASLAQDPAWATITAWQGGGLRVEDLEPTGRPGELRSVAPVPVHGEWKALVRIQQGRGVLGSAVYLPKDTAIPAPEVPASAAFTRPLVRDTDILQREVKDDVAPWLWTAAGGTVLALYLAFLSALAWGVGRVGRRAARGGQGAPPSAAAPSDPRASSRTTAAPAPAGA